MIKTLSIVLVLIASTSMLFAQPSTETQKAEEFFKNSSIVTYNEDYDPTDYIGSLIYYKKDKPNEGFKIIKMIASDDESIKRIEKGEIIYQKMHTKEDVSEAKFLGIFSAKVTNKNLLEVVLTKNYSLEAPNIFDNLELYNKVNKLYENLKNAGYIVEYIWKVNVNQITSRLYIEGNIQAGLNYQVQGSSKIYNQSEDFNRKGLITLQTYDASILLPNVVSNMKKVLGGTDIKSFTLEGFASDYKTEKQKKSKIDYQIADKIEKVQQ